MSLQDALAQHLLALWLPCQSAGCEAGCCHIFSVKGENRRSHKHRKPFKSWNQSPLLWKDVTPEQPAHFLNLVRLCLHCAWQRGGCCLLPWREAAGRVGGTIVWALLAPLTLRDPKRGNILSLFLSGRGQEVLQSSTSCQCQAHANSPLILVIQWKQVLKALPKSQSKASEPAMEAAVTPHKCFCYSSSCSINIDAELLIKKYLPFQILYVCWSYPGFWVYVGCNP